MGKDRCIWCRKKQPQFYKDKPYCMECATECVKECTSCHKPYDDLSFFELHPDHCNSCCKKLHNAKMKREVEKREEEQLKRSVLPPISVSDGGENLQSKIDDEEPMYMDHSRKA